VCLTKRPSGQTANGAAGLGVALAVGTELWQLELKTDDTRCGIEIIPHQPASLEQELAADAYRGALYVVSGEVVLTDGEGRVFAVQDKGWFSLTPQDREAFAALDEPVHTPLLTEPAWFNQSARPTIQRRLADQFEREFDPAQPVSQSIPATVRHRNPHMAELAVRALGVTNHYAGLVKALAELPREHEEARLAAIDGLRTWLAQTTEHGELLKPELDRYFQPSDAQTVYRLLWGFNETDARNPITSGQLVEWLDHPHVAIRELAFIQILRLTGRRYEYRANLPPAQRQLAVNRWRSHLDREGALVGP
jgi:hypothetical protein